MAPLRSRRNTGFSMIEVLMVVVVSGILFAITVPRIAELNQRSALRAARQMLGATFAAARSAAIQKGQPSTLTITSNSATVRVQSGINKQVVTVMGPIIFDQSLNTYIVRLGSAPSVVTYDVRGMASPRLEVITRYELRTASYRDTVCVSETGMLLQKDCKL